MPTTTNNNAVIAVFRNNTDAQAAGADLQAAGISRDEIFIETDTAENTPPRTTTTTSTTTGGGIKGWFKSMFGEGDDEDGVRYHDAIRRGNFILRVDVNDAQISEVEDILNRHSPVDVHEETASGQNAVDGSRNANTTSSNAGTIPVVQE
jgi:hypothetical protein